MARRRFCAHFNIRRLDDAPSASLVSSWVKRFRVTASAMNQKPAGRPRTTRTPDNIDMVGRAVNRHPRRSVRIHAQALQLSRASVHRILRKDLHLQPYKIQLCQYLKPADYLKRKTFAETMMTTFWNEGGIENIIFSDEAHFHLNGYVNKHNCRYWARDNPQQKHQRHLHSKKVTVWCAMSSEGIIGPYFFEDGAGRTVTVNSARYTNMIHNFLRPSLLHFPGYDANGTWFQQDGATAHTAETSITAVTALFPGTVISINGDIPFPPRSPDLTPLDFFLWGYLKSVVYTDPVPETIQQLKDRITNAIRDIPVEMCQRVFRNLRFRLTACYEEDGQHLNDVLFKR